jgi:hypothetical protein
MDFTLPSKNGKAKKKLNALTPPVALAEPTWDQLYEPVVDKDTVIEIEDLLKPFTAEVGSLSKDGKSYFWNTIPGDKLVSNCDIKNSTKKTIELYAAERRADGLEVEEVRVQNLYKVDPESDLVDPLKSLKMVDLAIKSIKKAPKRFETIVIENADKLWEWIQVWLKHPEGYAAEDNKRWANSKLRYSKSGEAMTFNYQFANLKMSEILLRILGTERNVIFTHKFSEIWKDNKNTGKYKVKQWKETPHAFLFSIRIDRINAVGGAQKRMATVTSRYQARRELGTNTFQLEDITYPSLMAKAKEELRAIIKQKSDVIAAKVKARE